MAAPISIAMALDTSEVAAGARKASDAIENVSDSLDDVARNADGAGEKLEDSLREAQRETADTEQSFKDLGRTARRNLDDVGDSARTNFGRAGQAAGSFKEEAISNFSEVTSSFDGSMSGIADGVQGTFGGAALALSSISLPAALAAGALGAVLGTAFETIGNDSEAMKEAVSENFRQMAEEGIESWSSVQSQMERLTDAYQDHEGEIQKIADLVGLPFETVAAAWAGNVEAMGTVTAAYSELKTNLRETAGVSVEAANSTIWGWNQVLAPLNNTVSAYDTAAEKAQRLQRQQSEMWMDAVADSGEYIEEVDAVGNKLLTLSDGTKVLIDVDTGLATTAIDTFQGDLDGIQDKKVSVTADTSAADRTLRNFANTTYGVNVIAQIRDKYGRTIV